MNNTFYFTQDSFKNTNSTLEQFDSVVSSLSEQINEFFEISGNALKYCKDIFDNWQWNGQDVSQLIWNLDTDFDNDLRSKLQNIFCEKASLEDSPSNNIEFKDLSSSSSNCLLAEEMNCTISGDHQITPGGLTWYEFCLRFIKRNPGSSDDFLDNCEIIFQNIIFLPNARTSIKSIYNDFKNKILFHLDGLNNNIRCAKQSNDADTLNRLSSLGHFEEVASPEGDHSPKRKRELTFDGVYCEPHIKLCHSDKYPGDSKYYKYRIYFNMNDIQGNKGKVKIGHIGKHA